MWSSHFTRPLLWSSAFPINCLYCGGLTTSHLCRHSVHTVSRTLIYLWWSTTYWFLPVHPQRVRSQRTSRHHALHLYAPALHVTVPVHFWHVIAHFSKLSLNAAAAYKHSYILIVVSAPTVASNIEQISSKLPLHSKLWEFSEAVVSCWRQQNDVQWIQSQ